MWPVNMATHMKSVDLRGLFRYLNTNGFYIYMTYLLEALDVGRCAQGESGMNGSALTKVFGPSGLSVDTGKKN